MLSLVLLYRLPPGQHKKGLGWVFEATETTKILKECFCILEKYLKLHIHHWIAYLNCFRICNPLVLALLDPGMESRRMQQTSLASYISIFPAVYYKWGSRYVCLEKSNGGLVEKTVQNSLYLYKEIFRVICPDEGQLRLLPILRI